MLGKLLKYEIKATARLFFPIYLAILLFAFINRLINPFENIGNNTYNATIEGFNFLSIIQTISVFVYFALIVAVIAMTLVIIIQRFYKNLLGDEGYLMFTLPVKPWHHIVSKLLISLVWIIFSFIIIMCSVLILINIDNIFGELAKIINAGRNFFGDTILILIPISALIVSAYFIMTVYNALSIGHLFTKHRILASFGAYIGIYIISQIVFTISVFASMEKVIEPLVQSPVPIPSKIITLITFLTTLYGLLGIGNFVSANIILNRKLNLE